MIHQLLNLTRPLIIFDAETTGTDYKTARIIEFGFQSWTAQGLGREWRSFIRPGCPIPQESTDIHGITDEKINACRTCGQPPHDTDSHQYYPWPRFQDIAANIAHGFSNCDFAGKSVRFDLRITAAEMARAGVAWHYSGARIIDADRLEQIAEPRSLTAMYKKYTGKDLEGAHGALTDVTATLEVVYAQLNRYDVLPRDLDALHELQWPGWIDSEGRFMYKSGVPYFGNWGKHANRPMRTAETGYWDFMLSNDFSPELKTIARNAKLGIFPSQESVK